MRRIRKKSLSLMQLLLKTGAIILKLMLYIVFGMLNFIFMIYNNKMKRQRCYLLKNWKAKDIISSNVIRNCNC